MSADSSIPVVLCLSGHDPSGGAGVQADIESIAAQGCFAATAITCLTVQDTRDVHSLKPVSSDLFRNQVESILDDYSVAAIKIGLLGSIEIAHSVASILTSHPHLPVVLDPILAAGGGAALAGQLLIGTIREEILPHVALALPNRHEARLLSGKQEEEHCAHSLLDRGCKALLITGADETTSDEVVNNLYQVDYRKTWRWPKLPGKYHGSGCTLASSVAARLAQDDDIIQASEQAQQYVWQTLKHAFQPGKGQKIPNRLYPCRN